MNDDNYDQEKRKILLLFDTQLGYFSTKGVNYHPNQTNILSKISNFVNKKR